MNTEFGKKNSEKTFGESEPDPGTGTGLQRGYLTCPWDRGQVSFDLPMS